MTFRFQKIWIDKGVKGNNILKTFLNNVNVREIEYIHKEKIDRIYKDTPLKAKKRTLIFTIDDGKMFKRCPGMIEPYRCCNLWTLNLISNCPINCSYCFLQFYLNQPVTTVYLNIEKAVSEILVTTNSSPKVLHRVTTGEFSDSLALEPHLSLSPLLIETFQDTKNAILELKTKTSNVDHLLELPHNGRTVISWSLNSPYIIDREERGSSSLTERLKAVRKVQDAGYLVGFHFDPIIFYNDWEREYEETVRKIFSFIKSDLAAWISLGTLRFAPGLEIEMSRSFPGSKLPYGEFVKASDGKMRYLKPLRLKLYKRLLEYIKKYGGDDLFVYLCMETEETWQKVMGFAPESVRHLDYLFAENLYKRFPYILPEKPMPEDYLEN